MLHGNVIMLHVDKNKFHINILMLYVDAWIIHLTCRGRGVPLLENIRGYVSQNPSTTLDPSSITFKVWNGIRVLPNTNFKLGKMGFCLI